MSHEYRVCARCVMDTSDPNITFDAQGVCNHCHGYDEAVRAHVFGGEEGQRRLAALVDEIKQKGAGKPYDCIIGVSGGVDSTYVALLVKRLGLRPLAVHLDNGWDSELAVANIHAALNALGIDLHTHVIDWEEFRDLQLAFLRASTPDSEIPSDHAIVALMYEMAQKIGVEFIISGVNRRTESHLPRAWSQGHSDWKYIRSVHRRFGRTPLRTYPHFDLFTLRRYLRNHRWIDVLNYVDYAKLEAIPVLERELGWRNYGGKHFESIYTRFYQGYILPKKFGYDKRRTHLSSLVCSGEITREQALEELGRETYTAEQQAEDRTYVVKKLGLTPQEFDAILALPKRRFEDYPSYQQFYASPTFRRLRRIYRFVKRKPLEDV